MQKEIDRLEKLRVYLRAKALVAQQLGAVDDEAVANGKPPQARWSDFAEEIIEKVESESVLVVESIRVNSAKEASRLISRIETDINVLLMINENNGEP